MRHPPKETSWLLLEAPLAMDHGKDWVAAVAKHCTGIFIRLGEGVSPLALAPLIRKEGLETGIFLHQRDMTRIALASLIRSAMALEIKRVFVGEPLPLPSVMAVGSADGPAFVEFAKTIAGNRIRFGACNLLAHPRDLTLAARQAQAGLEILAIPHNAIGRPVFPRVEIWNWRRTPQDPHDAGRPNLIDIAQRGPLTPPEIIAAMAGFFPAT